MRQKVVETARAWLGLRESDGSFRQIIDVYNTITPLPRGYRMTYSDAWCAAFVSAVAQRCGLTSIIYPECGCDPMIQLYKNHDRWQEDDSYLPDPGDIVFYDWQDSGTGDNKGGADHVGIVCEVNGNTIKVIEGNKSDAVGYRTINRNERYIRGFGLPDYAEEDEKADGTPSYFPHIYQVPINLLKLGNHGPQVKSVQKLLGIEPTGNYGKETVKAVKQMQKAAGIEVDGEFGWQSFVALWNRG